MLDTYVVRTTSKNMAEIKKILHIENHKTYAIVHVQLEDGEEAAVFVGGQVEVFYDDKHNKIKAWVKKALDR